MLGALAAAVAGLAAGVLSGLLGIGGALLTTPVVRLVFERPELVAVGTPLAVVLPTALAGAFTHARGGTADVRAGVVLGAAGAPLAVLGAASSVVIGGTTILLATAGVFAYLAVRMWVGADQAREPVTDSPRTGWAHLAVIGVAAGFMSGLMGLGGGFVMVPLLVGWLGFSPARASGTSLVAVAMFALPGALTHGFLGNIEPGLAAALAAGVVPGAILGARLAQRLSGPSIQRAFALFFLAGAVALAHNEIMVLSGG